MITLASGFWSVGAGGMGTNHMPVVASLLPVNIVVPFFVTTKLDLVKVAMQLSSHNWPIDNKFAVDNWGKMCARVAVFESVGIGSEVSCVEYMNSPLGNFTCSASVGLVGKVVFGVK